VCIEHDSPLKDLKPNNPVKDFFPLLFFEITMLATLDFLGYKPKPKSYT